MTLNVDVEYSCRGAVMAHPMGYGKTRTTIGLVLATLEKPGGTLVLVPPHLHGQWVEEAALFLDKKFQKGWLTKRGESFSVFAPSTAVSLQKLPPAGAEPAMVVVPWNILLHPSCRAETWLLRRWKRVVYDEAHLLKKEHNSLLALIFRIKAESCICLTATPGATYSDVRWLASLLDISLEGDRVAAKRIFEDFVRTHEAEVDPLPPLVSHTEMVQLTPEERLLYDEAESSGAQGVELLARSCVFGKDGCASPAKAVEELLNEKKACASRLRGLAVQTLTSLDAASAEGVLAGLSAADRAIGEDLARGLSFRGAGSSEGDEAGAVVAACRAARELAFLEGAVREVQKEAARRAQACSVCMDDLAEQEVRMTACGHTYCRSCAVRVTEIEKKCSVCRLPLMTDKVFSILDKDRIHAERQNLEQYGSKMRAVVVLLRRVCDEEKGCKVVIFTQHQGMHKQIAKAMTLFGIRYSELAGAVAQQTSSLKKWKEDPANTVLLMTAARCSSGLNLTAASKLIFVHPMVGDGTAARSLEQQAVGRLLRYGQKAALVQVWHFVTEDTIEERLHVNREASS